MLFCGGGGGGERRGKKGEWFFSFEVEVEVLFSFLFSLIFSYLDEPREALVGLVLRRDRRGPRKLQLGQLDLGLAVVDPGGDLAPGAPLFDGLVEEFF